MEDEIRKLMEDDDDPAEDLETIPRMECQAFEHHDYLVFMFHDLRDWMQALQLMGGGEVDYSITRRTKKIGVGRVLHGKRLLELFRKASSVAGTGAPEPAAGDPEPGKKPDHDQPQAVSRRHAGRARKEQDGVSDRYVLQLRSTLETGVRPSCLSHRLVGCPTRRWFAPAIDTGGSSRNASCGMARP